MFKNTVAALIATTAMFGVAAPAFADTNVFGSGSTEMQEFIADGVLATLQQRGIKATSVEEWNGLVRAFVTREDGTQSMQFFTPGSLQQVTL